MRSRLERGRGRIRYVNKKGYKMLKSLVSKKKKPLKIVKKVWIPQVDHHRSLLTNLNLISLSRKRKGLISAINVTRRDILAGIVLKLITRLRGTKSKAASPPEEARPPNPETEEMKL